MTTTYNSLSHEEFVKRVNAFNPAIKVIGQYDGINKKILVEDEYGLLNVIANSLFVSLPTIQVAVNKTEYWKNKYNIEEVHNYKYDYSKTEYKGAHVKMTIICPEHGEFLQHPFAHVRGHGCWECCKKEIKGGHGGLNLVTAERKKDEWENQQAYLYYIKMNSETENFYKIGITTQDLQRRFRNMTSYSYEILNYVTTNLYEAVKLERSVLELTKDCKYMPAVRFDGYTECFSSTIPEINDLLLSYTNNSLQPQLSP